MNSWTAADLSTGLALAAIVPALWIEPRLKRPAIAIALSADPIIGVKLARFDFQKKDVSHPPSVIRLPISTVRAILNAAHSRIRRNRVALHPRDCRRRLCHVLSHRWIEVFTAFTTDGHLAEKAESLCLKLQNSKP